MYEILNTYFVIFFNEKIIKTIFFSQKFSQFILSRTPEFFKNLLLKNI